MLGTLASWILGQTVDFVALDGQILTVRSSVALKTEPQRLRLRQEKRSVSLWMLPSSHRSVPGGYLCNGLVMRNLNGLTPGMREVHPGEGLRSEQRFRWRARVHSQDLPGFHATTLDLSPRGLQLEASHPLEVGRVLTFVVDVGQRDLTLMARVAWSEKGSRGPFRLGLEVHGPELEPFYRALG